MSLGDILKLATAISFLAPLFVAIGKLIQDRARRRQDMPNDAASAARVVQGMTLDLLSPLRQQVQDMTGEVQTLRQQVRSLNTELESERIKRRKAEDERDDAYEVLEEHELPFPSPRQG